MEFVGIEKQLFEELVRKFEYFEHRVMEICNRENDRTLHKWMDNQDVCRYLNISPRTLQTLRDTTGRCTSGWTIRTYAGI